MIRRFIAAAAFGVALAGCQGGSSSSLPAPGTSVAAAPVGPQSITVSILIPGKPNAAASSRRKPLYVSQNTQSAAIAVNGGTPVIANLAAGSASCKPASGTGRTCSIALSAPVGTDTFSETTYASTNGTGAVLSESTTSATIVAGKANVVTITLDGVVASIAVTLGNTAPVVGTAATIPLTVNFNDASGAAIIGNDPFQNPITLTDSDTSGATKISDTTLNSPADAAGLTVAYNGAAIASAVIGASASGVPVANVTAATLSPAATPTPIAFNDWPNYAYDVAHTGFNPNTTAITPASIPQLHLAWQTAVGGSTKLAQPIVVTNVAGHAALLIVANFAIAQAYDGLTGALVWSRTLPTQDAQDCGIAGISGTAAYDKALSAIFMAAGNGSVPNHAVLYRLDAATGAITGSTDLTPTLLAGESTKAGSGITLANGVVYAGMSSDCEGTLQGLPNWRGRVVSVDPGSMTLLNTFYPTWGQGGNYGGGGIWGWGGVSIDPSGNVYTATGNGENAAAAAPLTIDPPFVAAPSEQSGYAEQLVKLSSDLSTVQGANYPGFNFTIGLSDLDFSGTPVLFTPPLSQGCGQLVATQGKGGKLVINNTSNSLTVANSFDLSIPSGSAYYIGNPAYSPNTGYLYAAITSSGNGSLMLPPGLAAIEGCGQTIAWHAQFGPDSSLYSGENPRSAPTVTAGGVVFMGTPCTSDGNGGCGSPGALGGALWAVDATTGTVLGNGKPLVVTTDDIRMAPSADGEWVYVLDNSGNFYGYTIDPTVKSVAAKAGRRVPSRYSVRAN